MLKINQIKIVKVELVFFCRRDDTERLRFRFMYTPKTDAAIYGEISYNFARVCPRALAPIQTRGGINRTVYCQNGRPPLGDDWRLLFFETQRDAIPGTKEVFSAALSLVGAWGKPTVGIAEGG